MWHWQRRPALSDKRHLLIAVFAAAFVGWGQAAAAPSAQPSDAEVPQTIIQQSIVDYKATGDPCACPYDVARNGSICGRRTAGGAAPLCYPQDVSTGMVQDWRAQRQRFAGP